MKMTLSKAEVRTLVEIYSGKKTIAEIAHALHIGLSQASTVASRLEKKHLCRKTRQGKKVFIEMAETAPATAFRTLVVQDKPMKLHEFLFGLRFRILSCCLYESKTTEDMAKMLNVSRKSIQNVIQPLLSRQMLGRNKGKISFQKNAWPSLYKFLDAYRMFSLNGDVLWKFEDEMIFEVREAEEILGSITGFPAYGFYGVPLINVKYCCYLPDKNLGKTEIFMHSLLQIGDDTRMLEISLVFFKKNKLRKKDVISLAPRYDLRKKVSDFLIVLESNDEKIMTSNLPPTSRKDINDMMKLYGVL